jgi:hypothetical protein
MKPSRISAAILALGTLALLIWATRQYLGFHAFGRYQNLRSEVRSIQSDYEILERPLTRAIAAFDNPAFEKELGKLRLERARAENQYGDPQLRDDFLDRALDAFGRAQRLDPLDAWAYFEMGKAYFLYNYPLLTYADKGRFFARQALAFNPAEEFLNLEVLYYHFSQWDMLDPAEKEFAWARLEHEWRSKAGFVGRLRSEWVHNAKTDEGLRAILMSNPALWTRIEADFK